jgi:hypothetical protein
MPSKPIKEYFSVNFGSGDLKIETSCHDLSNLGTLNRNWALTQSFDQSSPQMNPEALEADPNGIE